MNGLQSIPEWKRYFGNPTGSILGVVNAAQSIGSVVSLPVVGWLSDRLGRRLTLLLGSLTIVASSAIQAASVKYGMFVFSRVLVGVGSMLVVQPAPMLITELAYPTHRGKYTRYVIRKNGQRINASCADTDSFINSAFWTMYYLGAILASWTCYGTQRNMTDDWTWRIPSIIQAGFPIVQILFWWCVPESPRYDLLQWPTTGLYGRRSACSNTPCRWLIANDRREEAEQLLARFHTDGDVNHPLVQFEMSEIIHTLSMEARASQVPWSTLVKTPGNRKRTFIAICVGAFAQWNVS